MMGRMILYRGSLKSCNYRCSYCPFSKHPMEEGELETDREQWESFVQDFAKWEDRFHVRALMVIPYGEALIHPWYWEGLARISTYSKTDAAGAQTNLSFPVQESLTRFDACGGKREKLRLWATFHPQMTTVEEFAGRCKRLADAGITLCAGAVGVPEHIGLIQKLREKLPKDIYLWINRMDGMKRPYTREEQAAFLEIDPYFLRELAPVFADPKKCRERILVEGSAGIGICNICFPKRQCERRICSCYLAYGGRDDFMNQILFGPYSLFRIPRRPKAVFFDINGTLLPKNRKEGIPKEIWAGLMALFLEKIPLFFATALPYQDAKKQCSQIWHMFLGGVFAGGAHLVFGKEDREEFYYLKESLIEELTRLKQEFHFRILTYRNQGRIYKITLCRTLHSPWSRKEIQAAIEAVPEIQSGIARYFIEESCLQIVSAKADKAEGVRKICSWMGISPKEAAAAGDSAQDAKMLEICAGGME